jgi:hypothetical protein
MLILGVGPALSGPSWIYLASSYECVYTQLIHIHNLTPLTFSSFNSAKEKSRNQNGHLLEYINEIKTILSVN